MKILAIKFKYLGDVVVAIPALRALKEAYPHAQLHYLVAEDAAPIVEHIPWIDKIWAFPRKRGQASLKRSLPILAQLRKEKFDLSVDFVGNDRGAILSLCSGAKKRLGLLFEKGFFGRKYCYHQTGLPAPENMHESLRDLNLLNAINVTAPKNLGLELYSDPSLKPYALEALGSTDKVLCHLSTSMPKKEWPLERWAELYNQDPTLSKKMVFLSGPSTREQDRLDWVEAHLPGAKILRNIPDLAHLVALIDHAQALICGDTAPAHIASGLGRPVVGIYGPSIIEVWHPLGCAETLQAANCKCIGHPRSCTQTQHCLSKISAKTVWDALTKLI